MMTFTIHATETNRSRLVEHALGGEGAAIAALTSLRDRRAGAATSNAHDDATGNAALALKPDCSTRFC